ncbi:MAG TPA: SRPBCC domain-containing protein [Baekduia sp.]
MSTEDLTLRIQRTYQAPAQAVFDAWTSEEVLRRWFHSERGWETPEAAVDLRVGGEVRVVMRNPDTGAEYGGGGRYTEIDPPRRLAFTWLWDDSGTRTVIELDFEESDGATTVRFTHSGLWDEAAVRDHEGGWRRCFDNLERALEEAGRTA